MKIKRYLVENMSEAIKAIKNDLGSEAIIVSSRKVRQKGWVGFFKPRLLEVTAAVDKTVERNPRDIFPEENNFKVKNEKKEYDLKEKEDSLKEDNLIKEITEIKSMIKQFAVVKKKGKGSYRNKHMSRWEQILLDWGINEELCKTLLKGIKIKDFQEQDAMDAAILEKVREKACFLLKELYCESKQKKVLSFIGPTGVGKTTTLVKLAAQFALFQRKKIGIITIDTYRIGAVEQLKTYGDIIDVPVEVVMTPAELKEALEKYWDKDVILVDTSGRSYKNAIQIRMLKNFLEKIPQGQVFLVLSCSTKESDLIKNVESFSPLEFTRFIFTKTDETDSLGTILNLALDLKIPVEYITNGQNVPDDIELMDPGKLAGMVLRGEFIEGSSSKVKRSSSV